MNWVRKALALFLENKGKFVLMIFSALVFIFLLFPFEDLSDLVSARVSKLTSNQVYLQFEKMRLSIFPSPGMAFEDVHVETAMFPAIKAQEIVISPAVSALITQKPAGSVSAKGFLRGNLDVSIKPGGKSDNGVERQKIVLNAQKLNLGELREMLQLPVLIKGNLDVASTTLADLSFQEQPDMDVTLKVERFELPISNVQTPMGPLTLPEVKLASVELKGRLSAGKFLIENGVIGKDTDELHGTIKGNMDLQIQNRDGSVLAFPGAYSFDIDLSARKSFQDRANLFLSFIDSYKIPTADGARYKFKVNASSIQMPPNISALR
jgi:type II secretion system protein N